MAGDTSVNPLEGLYTLQALHTKATDLNIDWPSRIEFQRELSRLLSLPDDADRTAALGQLSETVKAHQHNFASNLFELKRLSKPEAVEFFSASELAKNLARIVELEELPLGAERAAGLRQLADEVYVLRNSRLASHSFLEQLLDEATPSRIQEVLPRHTRNSFREAVEAALTLPEGEARAKILTGLNSGVNAAASSREYSKTASDMQSALKAKSPAMAAIHNMVSMNNRSMDRLLKLFRECYEKDCAKSGVRTSDGFMFYFEHEMYVFKSGLDYRGLELLGVAKADPATASDDTAAA